MSELANQRRRANALEADNVALRQLLKEYRKEHKSCCIGGWDMRCSICRKYDALEEK